MDSSPRDDLIAASVVNVPSVLSKLAAGLGLAAALLMAGCGGSSSRTTSTPTTTSAPTTASTATTTPRGSGGAAPATGELLSIPAIGRIYGRCKPGDRAWTVRFVAGPTATDGVTYRIGTAHPRNVNLDPGKTLTWHLTPGQFTAREPGDPVSHSPATRIKTTTPVTLSIEQGTEIHIYRVNITFSVAAAIGGTTDCALVSSGLRATTYYPGGQPPS